MILEQSNPTETRARERLGVRSKVLYNKEFVDDKPFVSR